MSSGRACSGTKVPRDERGVEESRAQPIQAASRSTEARTTEGNMMSRWEPMLDELVAQRYRHLVAYARMLTGETASAEDLVQDALITTFGRFRKFPSLVAAETYTRRVISSRFIDGT